MAGSIAWGVSHGQPGHLMLHPANRTNVVMSPVFVPSPCVDVYSSLNLSTSPPSRCVRSCLPDFDVVVVLLAEALLCPRSPDPCHVLNCRVTRHADDAPESCSLVLENFEDRIVR